MDAAVDEQRSLHAGDEILGPDEEQGPVEAVVGAHECLALDLVGADAVADAPERRRVHALALLPPVDARLVPVVLEPTSDERRRLLPACGLAAPPQGAEKQPEPVDLKLRPIGLVGLGVESVPRIPRPGWPRQDHLRAPVEEAVGALV